MSEKIVNLNRKWAYKTNEKSEFKRTMEIPCNWEIGGLHNYSGVVWFEKRFEVRGVRCEGKEFVLRFKGVDYFADVWLNGKYLGSHEGYFQPFEFNVTKQIKLKGENVLVVKVNSPKEDLKNWPHEKRYIKGIFGHHDIRPGSWSPRWGQMMGTGGIWNDVELIVADKVRIKDIGVSPRLIGKKAEIKVKIQIENYLGHAVMGRAVVNIRESRKSKVVSSKLKVVRIKRGLNRFIFTSPIKAPKLWWTWDHGEQNLYEVKVGIRCQGLGVSARQKFGIREIRQDKNGNWLLNGRQIFIRGTNVIPEEYLSTYSKERVAKDIQLIKKANVNAIRVHAHVNRKELYDACDEAGILVWQDFALQWEYQDTAELKRGAAKQIKDMVNLLYNHPSIVLWCCHNEPIKSKKGLDRILLKTVKALDKTRIVLLSSDFCEHPYPGWFWGKKEYFIARPGGTLPSEFGSMALPSAKTMRKMFKRGDLWPPNWIEWAKRDFTYEQMFHIAKISMGKSLNEFIKNSQDYQAALIKFVIEHYRQKKFIGIAGLFHFLLLEPWPCISYSVLDYYREPKKGFYALQAAYQPVLAVANFNRYICGVGRKIEAEFYVLNDLGKGFKNLKLRISFYKGSRRMHEFNPIRFDLEKNCCKYLTPVVYSLTGDLEIPKRLVPGNYSLVFDVFSQSGLKLSSNSYDIKLERIPLRLEEFNAHFVWE